MHVYAPLAAAVARRHPRASPEQVRARLARFGFRGAVADRLVSDPSGDLDPDRTIDLGADGDTRGSLDG